MRVGELHDVVWTAKTQGVDKNAPDADTVFLYLPGDICMNIAGLSIEYDADGRAIEMRIEGSGVDIATERTLVLETEVQVPARDKSGRFTKRRG